MRFADLADRPTNNNVLTFYALGDWGTGKPPQAAVAAALAENINRLDTERNLVPFVLELGDNFYEWGLPRGWQSREKVVQVLRKTFGDMYKNVRYKNQLVDFHIVPGNHDYAGRAARRGKFGDVIHEETTAEALYPNWKYYPIDPAQNLEKDDATAYQQLAGRDIWGLTLPEEIDISTENKVGIFAIDTQVMLELYESKNRTLLDLHWHRLDSLVSNSPAQWKLIMGHHPIRTHGTHGGFVEPFWWIPPLTIVPIIDKLFVKLLQDTDHWANREFQHDMAAFLQDKGVPFYLSGHEHSLQFLGIDDNHFQIISGSAAKLSGLTHKEDTFFSQSANGFLRFDVTDNAIWLEFLALDPDSKHATSSAVFRIMK